jgi:hypothetical protein
MPDYKVYKVYLIGDEGHSPERPEIITCTSDQEAASRAVELTARRSNAGPLFMRYLLLVSIRISPLSKPAQHGTVR